MPSAKTEKADLIVRTGVGTPMGNLLRRYWVPAMLSEEIPEPDCPPVRVPLMGEKLLGFRDSKGRPGLIREKCAHRGVSLFFGRNEDCGVRCAYHGWKFDIHGQCVDLPSHPAMAKRVKIPAYPCIEQGDVIWAYMGPPELMPEPPGLEWSLVPGSHLYVSKRWQECNYLQAMEGGIDTSHVSFVHRYEFDADPSLTVNGHMPSKKYIVGDPNVVFETKEVPSGLTIFGRRNGEADSYYYRITQWIFPWFTLVPPTAMRSIGGHVWVPIDDENCWTWNINYYPDKPLAEDERSMMKEGAGIHGPAIPGTYLPVANKRNDYLIDRKAQKENRAYSGIFGLAIQDSSLQESMGPIQDHDIETLVGTDAAIIKVRDILYDAAINLQKGAVPPAHDTKSQSVRSASALIDKNKNIVEWAHESLHATPETPVYSL
jgi:nitrite reductase/ring-hydroxylating ferredoxin subunit